MPGFHSSLKHHPHYQIGPGYERTGHWAQARGGGEGAEGGPGRAGCCSPPPPLAPLLVSSAANCGNSPCALRLI